MIEIIEKLVNRSKLELNTLLLKWICPVKMNLSHSNAHDFMAIASHDTTISLNNINTPNHQKNQTNFNLNSPTIYAILKLSNIVNEWIKYNLTDCKTEYNYL